MQWKQWTRRALASLTCGLLATAAGAADFADGFESPPGTVLNGPPDAPAMSAIQPYGPFGVAADDIVSNQVMSRLTMTLRTGATVAQVNAVLADIDGQIVTMRPGQRTMTVSVPRQPDAVAMNELIGRLELSPAVFNASPAFIAKPQVLPPVNADGEALDPVFHLYATRYPAAWNVLQRAVDGCESRKVPVMIADFFGDAPFPGRDKFDAEFGSTPILSLPPMTANVVNAHGYQVTAIAVAPWNERGPTGTMPFRQCVDLRLLNIDNLSIYDMQVAIIDHLPGTRAVLNMSVGQKPPPCEPVCEAEALQTPSAGWMRDIGDSAITWIDLAGGRWDRFLHVNSAGNERDDAISQIYFGFGVADTSASWMFGAALADPAANFPDLLGALRAPTYWEPHSEQPGFPSFRISDDDYAAVVARAHELFAAGPPEPNMITVGATTLSSRAERVVESAYSNVGAHVAMPVDDMIALDGESGLYGTSFAAPQVTGLVAYLWLLSPELREAPISDTMATIRDNIRVVPGSSNLVDAYASVLALDAAATPTPANSPIRLTLFDLNNDGAFDATDLTEFVVRILEHPDTAPTRDYGRHDLNGNGWTGGSSGMRFDLDRTGSFKFGHSSYRNIVHVIEGVEQHFDENNVTDLDILCFYAYSALYTGDSATRSTLLASPCAQRVTPAQWISFTPQQIVVSGDIALILETGFNTDLEHDGNNGVVHKMDLRNGAIDEGVRLWPDNDMFVTEPGLTAAVLPPGSSARAPVVAAWMHDRGFADGSDGQGIGYRFDVWVRYYDPLHGTWEPAAMVGSFVRPNRSETYSLKTVVDAHGNAMLTWAQRSPFGTQAVVYHYSVRLADDPSWTLSSPIPGVDGTLSRLTMTGADRSFTVLWNQYAADGSLPMMMLARRFDATTVAWQPMQTVSDTSVLRESLSLGTSADGDLIAAWRVDEPLMPGISTEWVAHYDAATDAWTPPQSMGPLMQASNGAPVKLVVDARGDALLMSNIPPNRQQVMRRYHAGTDTWEDRQPTNAPLPPLLDENGNGGTIEAERGTNRVRLFLRRYRKDGPGDGWSAPTLIADYYADQAEIRPAYAVAADGRTVVAWIARARIPGQDFLKQVIDRGVIVLPP